jgi:hypothetical protein
MHAKVVQINLDFLSFGDFVVGFELFRRFFFGLVEFLVAVVAVGGLILLPLVFLLLFFFYICNFNVFFFF